MGSQRPTWTDVRSVALTQQLLETDSQRNRPTASRVTLRDNSLFSRRQHAHLETSAAPVPDPSDNAGSGHTRRRFIGRQRSTKRFEPSMASSAPDAVLINNVPVSFPFPPYEAQREYMSALIQALQNRENALLESPTGTGKTLSLLCATLAWRTAYLTGKLQRPSTSALADTAVHPGAQRPTSRMKRYVDDVAVASSAAATEIGPEFQVIYSSRTHSQLAQVMQELRRTVYRDTRSGILGSRDQFCINPRVYDAGKKSHALLTRLCKDAVQKGACEEYKAFDHLVRTNNDFALAAAVDIEDIAKVRMQKNRSDAKSALPHACPFFASRHVAESAEILFMPYNYLLDMVTRARSQRFFKLQDAVVIVDEGHNIAQTCEEAASFVFRISDIAATLKEVEAVLDKRHQNKLLFDPEDAEAASISEKRTVSREDLRSVCEALRELDVAFEGIGNTSMMPLKPLHIEDIMNRIRQKTKISYENVTKHINALAYVLEDDQENGAAEGSPIGIAPHVDAVRTAMLMLFFPQGITIAGNGELPRQVNGTLQAAAAKIFYNSYLVTVNDPPTTFDEATGYPIAQKPGDKLIRCLCLSPHNALRSLLNNRVRSLIITSGTLSPMNLLTAELGIPLQVQIACKHIIDSSQISGLIVSRAPPPPTQAPVSAFLPDPSNNRNVAAVDFSKEILLRADFNNRNNTEYQLALGAAIVKCLQCVPGGVLIFFASYSFMETCVRVWHEKADIMKSMKACKRVFVEDRDRDKFRADLLAFREVVAPTPVEEKVGMFSRTTVVKNSGAVFYAVCRGKVSEGIDFPDDCARAVIIVGIPFINTKEERVILKRHYLDTRRGNSVSLPAGVLPLTGSQWYTREAWVAINQAIGRVIRHRDDFGVCILMDDRFLEEFQRVRRDLQSSSTGAVDAPQKFCSNLPRYIHESLMSYPLNKTLAILRRFFAINTTGSMMQRRLVAENAGNSVTTTSAISSIPPVAETSAALQYYADATNAAVNADNLHDNDSKSLVEFLQKSWKIPANGAAVISRPATTSSSAQGSVNSWPFTDLFGNESKVKSQLSASQAETQPVVSAAPVSDFNGAVSRKRVDRRARAAAFRVPPASTQSSPASVRRVMKSRVAELQIRDGSPFSDASQPLSRKRVDRRVRATLKKSPTSTQTYQRREQAGADGFDMNISNRSSQSNVNLPFRFFQKLQSPSPTQISSFSTVEKPVNSISKPFPDVITIDSSDDDDAEANIMKSVDKFSPLAAQPVAVRSEITASSPAKVVKSGLLGSFWR